MEAHSGLVTIRKRSQVLDFTGVTPRFRIVTCLKPQEPGKAVEHQPHSFIIIRTL